MNPRHAAAVLLAAAVCLPGSARQDEAEDRLAKLPAAYGKLTSNVSSPLPLAEAEGVFDQFGDWRFDRSRLTPEQRGMVSTLFALASLSQGDAAAAKTYVAEALAERADQPAVQELAYYVACAAGDGKLATTSVARLTSLLPSEAQAAWRGRARTAKMFGVRVGDVTAPLIEGGTVSIGKREGKPLVVFLWNLRKKPDDAQVECMRAQYNGLRDSKVEFIAVTANPPNQQQDAKNFARGKQMNWKHVFENRASGAPITQKVFKAPVQPMQVIIDAAGIVRAAGDVGDAGLTYALRAVAAEADTKVQPPEMTPADDKPLAREAVGEEDAQPAPAKEGELTDDRDAEQKLREARLMQRTGSKTRAKAMLEEIVKKHPNSKQAKDAQERLNNMP
ncbi:MAG: hypothetical protein CHACPFDD_03806 [Phycisphaerae bacterium]|nr:hypothetical protein [Phycisphaerae bacterium]